PPSALMELNSPLAPKSGISRLRSWSPHWQAQMQMIANSALPSARMADTSLWAVAPDAFGFVKPRLEGSNRNSCVGAAKLLSPTAPLATVSPSAGNTEQLGYLIPGPARRSRFCSTPGESDPWRSVRMAVIFSPQTIGTRR